MKQLVANAGVYGQTESELALRSDQPAGTRCISRRRRVSRRTKSHRADRFSSIMREGGWAITCTAEVVGEEHREQIDLIMAQVGVGT